MVKIIQTRPPLSSFSKQENTVFQQLNQITGQEPSKSWKGCTLNYSFGVEVMIFIRG